MMEHPQIAVCFHPRLALQQLDTLEKWNSQEPGLRVVGKGGTSGYVRMMGTGHERESVISQREQMVRKER